jgi:hypothetical protein
MVVDLKEQERHSANFGTLRINTYSNHGLSYNGFRHREAIEFQANPLGYLLLCENRPFFFVSSYKVDHEEQWPHATTFGALPENTFSSHGANSN